MTAPRPGSSGPVTSWADLAREVFRLSGRVSRYDGGLWSDLPGPMPFVYGVWGFSANDVYFGDIVQFCAEETQSASTIEAARPISAFSVFSPLPLRPHDAR